MKTTEKTLRELYDLGNKETREKLEKEFPTLFVIETKSILQQAIDYLTEEDEEVIKLRLFQKVLKENDNTLAEQKLIVIFKAKNEKHIFNWDNLNEYKYFIWFHLGDNFSYDRYCICYAISDVSARLCLKSGTLVEELSKEKEILEYFETYMKQ